MRTDLFSQEQMKHAAEQMAARLELRDLAARPTVLRCLHRSLNSSNPGGEPRNAEAKRQLTLQLEQDAEAAIARETKAEIERCVATPFLPRRPNMQPKKP